MDRTLNWLYQPRMIAILAFIVLFVARCDDFSTYPK